ncbi:MAG TPA: hypothetical protein VFU22_02545 [Roseiflexaceae bacterium]|nr:hypothetical protein [Roseiflexaceae bacterium]
MSADRAIIDVTKIEELLRQVRGVMAVRVVQDEQGQIDELHIVGSPGRSAKQMVRDVESLLYVRGGVRVDHRKISLVQIAETIIQSSPVRVRLLDISRATDDPPSISVVLGMDEQRVQGRARTERDDPPVYLAGYATIHALDQLIGARGQFRLENLERHPFGQLEVYLTHLSLTTDDGIETLLGISVVRDEDPAAVVRAILDAVNRRLQRLLSGERRAS